MNKDYHIDCSIVFRSSDGAVLKLCYNQHTGEVECEMEAILEKRIPVFFSGFPDNPMGYCIASICVPPTHPLPFPVPTVVQHYSFFSLPSCYTRSSVPVPFTVLANAPLDKKLNQLVASLRLGFHCRVWRVA